MRHDRPHGGDPGAGQADVAAPGAAAFGALVGGLGAWWLLGAVFEIRTLAMLGALAGAGAIAVLVAVVVTLLPVSRPRSASIGRLLSED